MAAEFTARFSVVKDFTARLNDELSISRGDVVALISDDSEFGDGWYMGKNLTTGEVGLYPKVFTKLVETRELERLEMPQKPGLLRSRSRRTPNQSPIDVSFNSSAAEESVVSSPIEVKGVHGYVNDIDNALKELTMGGNDHSDTNIGPIGELNTNQVDLWTPIQVAQYFSFLGFDNETASKFVKHKISGGILMELELSHLKELDIDSFGTRYEVFKEIEELKKAFTNKSTGGSTAVAAAPVAKKEEFIATPTVLINNKSQESIDTKSETTSKQETPELNVENNGNFDKNQFLSPRRAPQPPNYPSPVARNPMKFGLNSPVREDRVSNSIINAHSRNSSFGGASSIYMDTNSQNAQTPDLTSTAGTGFSHKLESAGNMISSRLSTIINGSTVDFDTVGERRSVSAKEFGSLPDLNHKDSKRVHSTNTVIHEVAKQDASISTSTSSSNPSTSTSIPGPTTAKTSTFKSLTQRKPLAKTQTSAFQEGIQNINVEEAIKTASYSGWMFKRGNISIGSWKQRFFTLHKTRLSYFTSVKDTKERGLIDITSHKVLPANDTEDKISAVYAASAGYGRYMFKIVPPAPGSRMGLTFTQQKVHYFAVETKEEMRNWMSALMKATIEVDETIPVISSCVTPTIPLQKAQELMAIARETAQENLEKLQRQREAKTIEEFDNDLEIGEEEKEEEEEEEKVSSNDTSLNGSIPRTSGIKTGINQLTNGMSTPYLVTSGLMTPNNPSIGEGVTRGGPFKAQTAHPPIVTRLDSSEFPETQPPPLSHSNSFRRVLSLRRNRD